MAVTPNIGLVKQAGTEYGDYEITNDNLDKIDEEIGKRGKTVNGEGPDETGDYKVNEVPFARQIVTDDAQQCSGEFQFRTTGGDASLSDGPAKLVSIFGRSLHTGKVEESLQMTVNAVARTGTDEPITATIDRDTFVAYVQSSGTTTLTYTNAWSANPALYGVTVEGTPVSGDQIVIVYVKADRGLITNSNPSRFVSTGWNLYNHTNTYARVKKYSSTYGFLIGGSYTKIEYSATLTGEKTTITPASGYFTIPDDGYIWVTGGNNTNTYILMTWSDWGEGYEGSWKAYSESAISLTTIMTNFPYGLMQVGAVADEINFTMGKAISRIERMAYTAENVAIAEASGRDWDADTSYIYIVRASEVAYDVSATGDYTASDHGEEIIEGGTVPVFVQTLYGQNLVDKLRTDVLTKSADLVNNLTTNDSTKALSAAQGYALNSNIDAISGQIVSFRSTQFTINAVKAFIVKKTLSIDASDTGVTVSVSDLTNGEFTVAGGHYIASIATCMETADLFLLNGRVSANGQNIIFKINNPGTAYYTDVSFITFAT